MLEEQENNQTKKVYGLEGQEERSHCRGSGQQCCSEVKKIKDGKVAIEYTKW